MKKSFKIKPWMMVVGVGLLASASRELTPEEKLALKIKQELDEMIASGKNALEAFVKGGVKPEDKPKVDAVNSLLSRFENVFMPTQETIDAFRSELQKAAEAEQAQKDKGK